MKLGFAPWVEDPDEPDYMTPLEIEALAEKIAQYMKRISAEQSHGHDKDAGR